MRTQTHSVLHGDRQNGWTIDTLHELVLRLWDEHRFSDVAGFSSQEKRIDEAFARLLAHEVTAANANASAKTLEAKVESAILHGYEKLSILGQQGSVYAATSKEHGTAIARLTAEALAQREAVTASDKAQAAAIDKAEAANEKRFDSVNEFRAQLGDQARLFMPRAEVEVVIKALEAVIKGLEARVGKAETAVVERAGAKVGTRDGWLYAVGAVALVSTLMGIFNYVLRIVGP